ncbi:MAG: ABC transporter ATP-binding protein [Firmicutes bacterium]|nr:ABC transporter ATP-binding protein [Bacillota bacterium]
MTGTHGQLLVIDGISKSYLEPDKNERLPVLDDISFHAGQGEIVVIVGPSGCGKSTLLNIIAGFETAEEGQVNFLGKPVLEPSPQRAMVFQSAVLFPWLSVRDNICYGLKRKGVSKNSIGELTRRYVEMVGLKGFEDFFPEQLSGGMQQRTALARVLILQPDILLMDEPFASLDAMSRSDMQLMLLDLWETFKPVIIFVTHDVEEALFLTDKVYVMGKRPGKIIGSINVPFKRPRALSLTSTLPFAQLKSRLRSMLIK